MKYVKTLLEDLKNTDCDKSDEVVGLMYHITHKLDELGLCNECCLYAEYFGNGCSYVTKKDIDNHIEDSVERCREDGTSVFAYAKEISRGVEDTSKDWFYYNGDKDVYYDIDIAKLREDKKEFIKDVLEILE